MPAHECFLPYLGAVCTARKQAICRRAIKADEAQLLPTGSLLSHFSAAAVPDVPLVRREVRIFPQGPFRHGDLAYVARPKLEKGLDMCGAGLNGQCTIVFLHALAPPKRQMSCRK